MATFNTADDQARYALVPFDEAINYLGGKINQDTDKWDDLATPQEHDAAFVVAGMKGALLQDIRAEVEQALRDGKSREDFKKEFNDIVDRRGWSSKQGNDWRSSIIYQTNLRQAYGDGRCRQMNDPDVLSARPYRMWVHGDSRVPRPEHRAMNGKVFRADHPVAQTKFPLGFQCKCTWVSLSERDMKRRGLSVESGITWGSEIDTAKGRKVLQIDRGFGAPCKFESEREKEERKRKSRQDILDRIPKYIKRDATRDIAIALGLVALSGAGYVGYEFLTDGEAATQATVSIYQDIIGKWGVRKSLPASIDAKTLKLLNRNGFKQEVAKNLYDNAQSLQRQIDYEFAHPEYVAALKKRGLSTAEERFNYSMGLIEREGIHDDYQYALGALDKSNIPPEELAALRWYTSTKGYQQMNGILRGKTDEVWEAVQKYKLFDGTKEEWVATVEDDVRMATSALNRLPGYRGKVYRGLELPQEFINSLKVGDSWNEDGFMSTTNSPWIRYPGNAVFVVNSRQAGKNIIPFERYGNREILFAPGSEFVIKQKRFVNKFGQKFWLIRMDDINPKINLLEKLNKKSETESVVVQSDDSRIFVNDSSPENRPPETKDQPFKPGESDLSQPETVFEDLPDITHSLVPIKGRERPKKLGLEIDSGDRTLTPPMRDLPRDVSLTTRTPSDLVAPRDPILPPEPATRPAPPVTLEVRKITEDELSALRQSAKRDLPYRIRVNKNKDGTFNVQPVAGDGYKWSPEQAEIVGNYLRSKGVYLSDKFDPANAGWQEGANYLKVAFDAELPFEKQPLGDLSIQTESQKTRAKAYTLQQGLKDTTDKIDAVKRDKEKALERLATSLEIEEGNPFADEITKKFDDRLKVLERRAKQQKSKIQGFILDADKFDEYERRAATTFGIADNSSVGDGDARLIGNSETAKALQADVKKAIDRLPQAQRELDNLQRIEDDLKLSKELSKSVVDERKAIAKQKKELVKNILALEAELDRGEGLIGGRSGRSLDALNQARSQLAAIEIRLPELERGENAYKGQREALQELLDQSVTSAPELNREIKALQNVITDKSSELYANIKLFQRWDNLRSANVTDDALTVKPDSIRVPFAPKVDNKFPEKRYVKRAYADKYAAKTGGIVLVQKDENGKTIYVVVAKDG